MANTRLEPQLLKSFVFDTVTECAAKTTTESPQVGTLPHDQVPEDDQLPLATLVQSAALAEFKKPQKSNGRKYLRMVLTC